MATKKTAAKTAGKKNWIVGVYVIARCSGAGVHAGVVESADGAHVTLRDARRIWYWTGAASLSEIAVHGLNPTKSGQSKIAAAVPLVRLRDADVHELIVCTIEGRASIEGQPVWRA